MTAYRMVIYDNETNEIIKEEGFDTLVGGIHQREEQNTGSVAVTKDTAVGICEAIKGAQKAIGECRKDKAIDFVMSIVENEAEWKEVSEKLEKLKEEAEAEETEETKGE